MAPTAGPCCDGGMDQYGPATYGDRVADVYDDWYPGMDPTAECALPLAAAGVDVQGIDASPVIVEQMRAKPGGDVIPVTIGDMAEVPVDGEFSLVYVVFNTFFMLTSQEAQERCFRNVAAHLAPGGRFLVRTFVPDTSRIERGEHLSVRSAGLDAVHLDASVYNVLAQRVDATQIHITASGIRLVYTRLRYAYPPELDQMARQAGLEFESRWETFARDPYTDDSPFHVSVYRRPLT